MSKNQSQMFLAVALTAVFTGYFAVWLPGPAAGLRFIGVELGEWIKFLGVGLGRNWFYLPPITLGLMLAVMTLTWENGRCQNWLIRGLAVTVSLLALPAVAAIRFEPASEWRLRLALIGLVLLAALLTGFLERVTPLRLPWLLLALLGLLGAIGPTWFYLTIRPLVSQVLALPVGIGLGVWLNGLGHLGVTAVALREIRNEGRGMRIEEVGWLR